MNCFLCPPKPRCIDLKLQPTTSSLPFQFQPLDKDTRRICFFYDRPTFTPCCCSDSICTTNATFPLEKIAYRQIGGRILQRLRQRFPHASLDCCEYTNEMDLAFNYTAPASELIVNLNHDWPTVHEDPIWASNWLKYIGSSKFAVPSRHQILYLFEKTRYVQDILSATASNAMMLPTKVVHMMEESTENTVGEITAWIKANTTTKFVTKENFSAGKEGVEIIPTTSTTQIEKKLNALKHSVGRTSKTNKRKNARVSQTKQNQTALENKAWSHIHALFKGGNNGVFMLQQYEPLFLTESEKRLYFSKGVFLYAMGFNGWISMNAVPQELLADNIAVELEQSTRLMALLPRLMKYPLIRFDFGPRGLLSEVEVLPDLFGGPGGDLKGDKWDRIVGIIADAYVDEIGELMGLDGLSGGASVKVEVGNSKEQEHGAL